MICGDWEPLGDRGADGQLISAALGQTAAGGFVVAVERAPGDASTLWAATRPAACSSRSNADADPASAVTFTRLDTLADQRPDRFVSGIHVDPANANHAWVSYSGLQRDDARPRPDTCSGDLQPGRRHRDLGGPAATTSRDLPITDVARDDVNGDLYAASDFGVCLLPGRHQLGRGGAGHAERGGGRADDPPAARKLYAATHGQSAWLLNLP